MYSFVFENRDVYSSIIPPPPPWGGGKESKGPRAREENQRRVEKMERHREKKRKISVGFLSLNIGNENHISVLVINLCHNSP